jgi:hypothetical protein
MLRVIRQQIIIVAALLNILVCISYAGNPEYSIELGCPIRPYLKNYDGIFVAGLGARLPFTFWRGYQQFWLELRLNKFDFHNKGTEKGRILGPDDRYGKNASITTGTIGLKVFPLKEKRHFGPYAIFNTGFIKRSQTVIRTYQSYTQQSYKIGPAIAAGIGLRFLGNDSYSFEMDYSYNTGYTHPVWATFGLMRWRFTYRKL